MSDSEQYSDMEDSGSEDDYGRPSQRRKVQPEFVHTMTELEDEANKFMIKRCKLDACVDLFLAGVLQLGKSRSLDMWGKLPDFKELAGERLEALKTELRQNLDRLLPGVFPKNVRIPENKKLNERLEKRWAKRGKLPISEIGSDESPKKEITGTIPVSLFEVLMEKQARERSTGVQGNLSDSVTDDQAAQVDSCRRLQEFIDGEETKDCFTCGGIIPVNDMIDPNNQQIKPTSPRVKIFWSLGHDAMARKLVLPLDGCTPESTQKALEELVTSCDPASFGLGEKDVIDPAYRKAGKIDPDQFATTFHPADFGILENIEQVLLPTISDEVDNRLQFRKIKAELYKLNAYSGPSGLFRKHVDTPRSESQIGSLVVCLPSSFKGGSLIVQHSGQTIEFDWSLQSASTIQWAAFYSDCEHEIKTITDGDRITLTYNLFVTESVGGAIPSPTSIIDAKNFPLHGWMKNLLTGPDFMKEGGVLGMFCSHAYPHTSDIANLQLPRGLKGSDLVLYSVLKSLGIELAILPILDKNGVYAKNPTLGLNGTVGRAGGFDYNGKSYIMEQYLLHGRQLGFNTEDFKPKHINFADVDRQWKLLLMTRQIVGMDDLMYYADSNDLALKPNSFYEAGTTRVGTHLKPYEAYDYALGDGYEENEILENCFSVCKIPGITWIKEPKHREMAFSHIAHGNEPSIETRYSCVAILAVIPPVEKRMIAE